MLRAEQLFQTLPKNWPFQAFFSLSEPVYAWLPMIAQALQTFFQDCPLTERIHSPIPPQLFIHGDVYIGHNVSLPDFGTIEGPAYIGDACVLRPSVYIRGNVIAGNGCVLGNSCEFKNALLLEHVQAPHFNYVGDSLLGNGAHLGAGCILSNLRFDKQPVCLQDPSGEKIPTGLKKLGGILGDYAEAGCNAVLQPGACLFPHTKIFPCEAFRGTRTASFTKLRPETQKHPL